MTLQADRAARLTAYVEAAAEAPVVWGESDCSAWPARWVSQELDRPVPLPPYASRAEAHALIAGAGGLVNLWRRAAVRLGLPETAEPQLGDVGVIRLSDRDVGGIFAHGGIVLLRTDTGVKPLQPRPQFIVAAWSL